MDEFYKLKLKFDRKYSDHTRCHGNEYLILQT
jgi:hypothetical protein